MPPLRSFEGLVIDLLAPGRVVVAGCSFADLITRVFLVPFLDDRRP